MAAGSVVTAGAGFMAANIVPRPVNNVPISTGGAGFWAAIIVNNICSINVLLVATGAAVGPLGCFPAATSTVNVFRTLRWASLN